MEKNIITCTRRGPACTMSEEACRKSRSRAKELFEIHKKRISRERNPEIGWAGAIYNSKSYSSLSLFECLNCKEGAR